eukprot:SAG22_NODE_274_length_13178_cov_17.793715_2_plen_128_part_00
MNRADFASMLTKPGWIHMNLLDPYVSPRWCQYGYYNSIQANIIKRQPPPRRLYCFPTRTNNLFSTFWTCLLLRVLCKLEQYPDSVGMGHGWAWAMVASDKSTAVLYCNNEDTNYIAVQQAWRWPGAP